MHSRIFLSIIVVNFIRAKINRAWQYKNLTSLSLTSNAELAPSGRHQSGSQEVHGSVPTGGTLSTEFIMLFPT